MHVESRSPQGESLGVARIRCQRIQEIGRSAVHSSQRNGVSSRIGAATLLLAILSGVRAAAQPLPDTQHGFPPNATFATSGIDIVNLFNGNLVINIPLGPDYPVGAGFTSQLHLIYNSQIWSTQMCGYDPNQNKDLYGVYVRGYPILGAGWHLDFGRTYQDPEHNDDPNFLTADGSGHRMPSVAPKVSDDLSFLNFQVANEVGYANGDRAKLGTAPTQFDHGSTLPDFDAAGQYVTSLRNRFGDCVEIKYVTNTNRISTINTYHLPTACPPPSGTTPLRTANFTYTQKAVTAPSGPTDTWNVLSQISFPREGASTQIVVFDYYDTGFFRSPYSDIGCPIPTTVSAPLLHTVELDQGSGVKYTFKYWDTDTGTPANGSLNELDLPTGGLIQYQYGTLVPSPPVGSPAGAGGGSSCQSQDKTCIIQFRRKNILAITQRIEYPNGAGGSSNTWTYTRNRTNDANFVYTRTVEVGAPDGTSTLHYFHEEPDGTAMRQSVGIEYQTDYFDASLATPVRRLNYCYNGGSSDGTPICAPAQDPSFLSLNVREISRTTSIMTSGGGVAKTKKVQRNGWDGYGHFEQEDSFDWGGTARRKGTFTNWTPNTTSWILNLYDQRTETQYAADGTTPQSSVDKHFQFDTTTGFLKQALTYTGAPDNRSLVNCRLWYSASPGDVKEDVTGTLDGQTTFHFTACPTPTDPPVANVGTNSDAFGKKHSYKNGQVIQANWIERGAANDSIGWFIFDVDRADEDGAVTTSRDPSGLATTYSYDDLGRLTRVAPPSPELSTFICYDSNSQAATAYRSSSSVACPTTGVARLTDPPKTWERYEYDGFGRLVREMRQLDIGSFGVRKHSYDSMGHESSTSEWGACSTVGSCETASPPATARSNYDPFGRPQKIVGPGNSSYLAIDRTDGTGLYSDTKEVATGCVNGSWNGTACVDIGGLGVAHASPQTTTKRDAFDRIVSVTEDTGAVTSYAYDVNDKLSCVKQGGTADMTNCTSNPGGQYRAFTYDAFGFLRKEVTPEKGTVDSTGLLQNGSGKYGSLGNLRAKTEPGSNTISYLYDAAGRVACEFAGDLQGTVTDCGSLTNQKYVVNSYDGDGVGGGAYPKGKLTERVGVNPSYTPLFPAGSAPQVFTEGFFYDDGGGRLTSKTTSIDTAAIDSSVETWSYTNLGLVQSHGHPRVIISTGAPATFAESFSYKLGWPTSVSVSGTDYTNTVITGATISATYQPAGNLASYTAQQSGIATALTTTISPDTSGLPRPLQISSKWGTNSPLFNTGTMTYDAAGNVAKIGSDLYSYDTLSRLKHALLSGTGGGDQFFCYDPYGNRTAKGSTQPSCTATWSDNKVPTGASYDSRGNQIGNGSSETMTYDPLNRMIKDAPTVSGSFQYVLSGSDERFVKVPFATNSQGSTRREIARMVVQAKVLRGVWTLPTTPCAETTRRFTDVHCADPDWAYIETFAAQGITSGCGSGMYCPETVVARDQMAVFLLKIEHGGSYTPPMCTPPGSFLDVPCPAYQFANAIYRAQFEGLTNGCDATHYCPTTAVTETALATFLNKLVLDVQAYHGIQGGSFYTLRDEGNRLVTEFQDSMPARDNVYLGSLLVASYVSKTPTNSSPMWQFHVADHLGTIRASVRGSDGFVSEQHRYWPYGDEVGTPPLAQRLSFAAMEKDTESTHYYDHARTQDFGLGRFGSPDRLSGNTAQPWTWNRYSYAVANPLRYLDRDGEIWHISSDSPTSLREQFLRETSSAMGIPVYLDGNGNLQRAAGPPALGRVEAIAAMDAAIFQPETISVKLRYASTAGSGAAVDAFSSRSIFPEDLARFPKDAAVTDPEAVTQGELLTHVFSEYGWAAAHGGFNDLNFRSAHNVIAFDAQNAFRTSNGQLPLYSLRLITTGSSPALRVCLSPDNCKLTYFPR